MAIMRGLVMGRFQPFHLGHLDLVRGVLEDCDDIIVGVTSSQYNYIKLDPFTAGERIEMVRDSMLEDGIDASRFIILGLENQPNVAVWASYLRAALPRFGRVYSGNDYVAMLLADWGIEVVRPVLLERGIYNSTAIREAMATGGDWQDRVPAAVVRHVGILGGVARIRTIFGSDTDPTDH